MDLATLRVETFCPDSRYLDDRVKNGREIAEEKSTVYSRMYAMHEKEADGIEIAGKRAIIFRSAERREYRWVWMGIYECRRGNETLVRRTKS